MRAETIYVPLTAPRVGELRPVLSARRADGVFEILSRNDDPEDEPWEFSTGSLVRCERRSLAGTSILVAVSLEAPRTPRLVRGN